VSVVVDEYHDAHTRSIVLRGGSNYRPQGSPWYFPNIPSLVTHNKLFIMKDRYERAGTVGFRCAADEKPDQTDPCVVHPASSRLCGGFEAPRAVVDLGGANKAAGDSEADEWALFAVENVSASGPLASRISIKTGNLLRVNGTQIQFRYPPAADTIAGVSGGQEILLSLALENLTSDSGRYELTVYAGAFSAPHAITATLVDGAGATQARFTQTLNATLNDHDLPMRMHGGVTHTVAWKLQFFLGSTLTSPSSLLIKLAGRSDPLNPPALEPVMRPPKWESRSSCGAALCGRQVEEFGRPRRRGNTGCSGYDCTNYVGNFSPEVSHSLTAYGSLDWMHWGHDSVHPSAAAICPAGSPPSVVCPEAINRKCGVTPLIHPLRTTNASLFKILSMLSTSAPQGLSNGFSFSDGGLTHNSSAQNLSSSSSESEPWQESEPQQSGLVFNTHTGVFIGGASPPLNQTSELGGFLVTVDIPHSTQAIRVFVFLGIFTPDATNLSQPVTFSASLLDAAGTATGSFEKNLRDELPINPKGVQTATYNSPFELTVPPAADGAAERARREDRTLEIRLVGATSKAQIQIQAVAVDSDGTAPTKHGAVPCLPWVPPPSNVALHALVLKSLARGLKHVDV
jgi:hypothetical protein